MDYTILSENKYMLSGSVGQLNSLVLDSSNAAGGVVLSGWNTYDDGTYDDTVYSPCALYEGTFDFSSKKFIKFYYEIVGNVVCQFAYSQDNVTYNFTSELSYSPLPATFEARYLKVRIIFKSNLWTDSDYVRIYFNKIIQATQSYSQSILGQIKKNNMQVFRKLYIKKRDSVTGEYDSAWTQIPNSTILNFGNITYSIDDIIPSFYKFSGLSFSLDNSAGDYSNISDDKSIFYGAATIIRSLVKLEAGYEDEDGNLYPTDPTLYIGIITDNPTYEQSSKVNFTTKHLSSILEEFPADQIPGLGTTQTASQIITKIRDFVDANSIAVFQKYITSGDWIFTTTTQNYNMATSTSLQNLSCWGLLQKLAVAEESAMYMTRTGQFYFIDQDTVGTSITFHFSGIGDTDRTYGHNIGEGITVIEDVRSVYNRIKIKNGADETTTSYIIKNETWNWGNVSSSSFLYGVREYKYENIFLNNAAASTLADTLFTNLSFPKQKISFPSKFVPHLAVGDLTSVTYKTKENIGLSLWGTAVFGISRWGYSSGLNIELNNISAQLIELNHNIDNFTSKIKLKEI